MQASVEIRSVELQTDDKMGQNNEVIEKGTDTGDLL